MKPYFADTFFFLALLDRDDPCHGRTLQLSRELKAQIVTTRWILAEVGDALARLRDRATFLRLLDLIARNPQYVVVPDTDRFFEEGTRLFRDRPDKEWSLTDCTSFAVMRAYGLTDALSGDHHFGQAGFQVLLG